MSSKAKASKRASALLARYGITKSVYDAMVMKQNGLCAICSKAPTGTRMKLFVDHCHSTAVVRGLLCSNCNSGLGYFKDSAALLQSAFKYLTENTTTYRHCGVPPASIEDNKQMIEAETGLSPS